MEKTYPWATPCAVGESTRNSAPIALSVRPVNRPAHTLVPSGISRFFDLNAWHSVSVKNRARPPQASVTIAVFKAHSERNFRCAASSFRDRSSIKEPIMGLHFVSSRLIHPLLQVAHTHGMRTSCSSVTSGRVSPIRRERGSRVLTLLCTHRGNISSLELAGFGQKIQVSIPNAIYREFACLAILVSATVEIWRAGKRAFSISKSAACS